MSTRQFALAICIAVIALCIPLTLITAPATTHAEKRAALVVQFDDGSYVARCVSFSEDSITGLELLTRSGLQVSLWGGAVCRIEQVGCNYPAQPCFCQCKGSSCQYWSYWHWRQVSSSPGQSGWMYAQVGSADYHVQDGDLQAWLWGDAQNPPIALSFADVCGPSPAATSPASGAPLGSGETGTLPTSSQGAGQTEAPASLPTAQGLTQYAIFAVMAMALAAGFWFLRGREAG